MRVYLTSMQFLTPDLKQHSVEVFLRTKEYNVKYWFMDVFECNCVKLYEIET